MEQKQGIGKVTGVAKAPESSKPRKKGDTGCQFLGYGNKGLIKN